VEDPLVWKASDAPPEPLTFEAGMSDTARWLVVPESASVVVGAVAVPETGVAVEAGGVTVGSPVVVGVPTAVGSVVVVGAVATGTVVGLVAGSVVVIVGSVVGPVAVGSVVVGALVVAVGSGNPAGGACSEVSRKDAPTNEPDRPETGSVELAVACTDPAGWAACGPVAELVVTSALSAAASGAVEPKRLAGAAMCVAGRAVPWAEEAETSC
jgi:hypothetical protein